MPPTTTQVIEEHFSYSAQFTTLVSATTVIVNVTIQADADFIIAKQMRDVRAAGARRRIAHR